MLPACRIVQVYAVVPLAAMIPRRLCSARWRLACIRLRRHGCQRRNGLCGGMRCAVCARRCRPGLPAYREDSVQVGGGGTGKEGRQGHDCMHGRPLQAASHNLYRTDCGALPDVRPLSLSEVLMQVPRRTASDRWMSPCAAALSKGANWCALKIIIRPSAPVRDNKYGACTAQAGCVLDRSGDDHPDSCQGLEVAERDI